MLCGALCGVGQAFLCGSVMAYASIFSQPRYLQAVLAHPVFREAAHHTKFLETAADEFVQVTA